MTGISLAISHYTWQLWQVNDQMWFSTSSSWSSSSLSISSSAINSRKWKPNRDDGCMQVMWAVGVSDVFSSWSSRNEHHHLHSSLRCLYSSKYKHDKRPLGIGRYWYQCLVLDYLQVIDLCNSNVNGFSFFLLPSSFLNACGFDLFILFILFFGS